MAYERTGVRTGDNSNVVFICHALTGDAHVAGIRPGDTKPSGWWENMIGPGKGIDTNRYQVICANILGGCKGTTGPASICPNTGKPYGGDFPKITVGDIIEVHRLLLKQLGINRLAALVGGSFGGMQVLEWLIRHSPEIDRAIVVASAASLSSQALAFDIVGRQAIVSDPNWNTGNYYDNDNLPLQGLSSARKMAHITYLSQQLMDDKFGREKRPEWLKADKEFRRRLEQNFGTYFQIESYLQHQGEKFIRRFDANSYLHITLAMDEYDIAERYGSLDNAFARISETSRALIVSLSGDWLFMPEQSEALVTSLIEQKKRVSYCHLDAEAGHDAFLTHIHDLKRVINSFMTPPPQTKPPLDRSQVLYYRRMTGLVPRNGRVLDLGCGDGTLLNLLKRLRNVSGNGVEIDIEQVVPAMGLGCDILREDIDDGLAMIPENSFDLVVLSETLQTIKRPRQLLHKILKVAPEAVISFPNFGSLDVRMRLLIGGRMPKGRQIPFEWYDTPNIHLFTLKDFRELCEADGIEIIDLYCESESLWGRLMLTLGCRNLGASKVIVRIARKK